MANRFVLMAPLLVAAWAAADAPPGLCVGADGALVKDGRPYRAIGVNYFDCFARTLHDPRDRSYERGFAILQRHGIPFARFMACGYWPREMRLYLDDKEAYFRRLDGVIESARRHNVGLIPSLFWHTSTVPDLVGESRNQWGNPESRTRQFMRRYTAELVARYKDHPAVWGWEFGNEYALDADLPNAASHRPPIIPSLGTPTARSASDDLTHEQVRGALVEFAREVRRHDSRRIIASGNAFPRPTAWHQQHERSWGKDSPGQYAQMLLADNPDPMNVISVHAYGQVDIAPTLRIAQQAGKPLFVGEFGVSEDDGGTRERFAAMLEWIETHPIPLAALWVYDFSAQKQWNVTADNQRSYQLQAIAAANRRLNPGP